MGKRIIITLLASGLMASGHEGHDHLPAGKVATSAQKTGNGQFIFETVPGFGAMPEGVNVGPTHGGVAVDGAGDIYVSTEADHGVVKFSAEGHFKAYFGPSTQALQSLAVVREGEKEVLVGAAVSAQKVLKLDLNGGVLLTIPNASPGKVKGGFKGVYSEYLRRPCAVSILGDYAAVAELEGRVTIVGKNGEHLAFLGDQPDRSLWAKKPVPEKKLFDGLFTAPHGVSWDAEGSVIVQDWNVTGRVTKLQRR